MSKKIKEEQRKLFSDIKNNFLDYDPAHFIQNNLTLDGSPFSVLGNGWKFMADVYRYVALQASRKNGKPVIIKKGRQVGATMMAGALDLYFTNSGIFSDPPIRVAHLFPSIGLVKRFSQDKLESLIRDAKGDFINNNKLRGPNAVDNMTMKQFKTGTLWVESIGADGDRIRGTTFDVAFFDECFPYNQFIETDCGKIEIGKLYELYRDGKSLPLARSYNEETKVFEYKRITKAWNRGVKPLIEIRCSNMSIRCTKNHKFLTTHGWVEAGELGIGSELISAPNSLENKVEINIVDSISEYKSECTYDISVEDNHNFIVTTPLEEDDCGGGPVVHNCQDMYQIAIGNSTKTLTAAKYGQTGKGVQVYFGTPKEKGTWFEMTWNMSDQRYYHLGCPNCEETYPFYLPNDDRWKDIWIGGYDIKCPICGHISKKIEAIELGKWVSSRPNEETSFVGFHINQFYIPHLTREYIDEQMPENNPSQSERVWNNEVVGEFYSGVGMPLTRQDIELYCKDADRAFSKQISSNDKRTYLGVDWGDKTGQDDQGESFSCVVVLSDVGDGTLLIEHAHKLRERHFEYKKSTIKEMYRRFGIKQGVSDFFFGQDVVRDVQSGMGDRFLGAQGSGNLLNALKYREDELMISYNKDLMIDELFDKIRKGKIRFPWKSYEYVEWLIDHCTSMGTALRAKTGGQLMKTYVKGTTPNDGLMALMYAYMAWKFDFTDRFTIKPGKTKTRSLPRPALAFAPKLRT